MNSTIVIRRGKSQAGLKVQSQVRTRSQVLPMVAQASVVFLLVFIVGNFVLSLGGHILAEGQRAQVKAMAKPLQVAREDDRNMKTIATSEKSQESVEEWAEQRGFVRKSAPVVRLEDTYVAQK